MDELTSDKISSKPLNVVPRDPMNKRKQAVEILKPFPTAWRDTAYPLPGSRLVLNVRICRVDGEDALSSCNVVGSSLVTVVQIYTKDLCKAVANLGGSSSHVVAVSSPVGKSDGQLSALALASVCNLK
jgi:hypothetical protein